jgi:DNA-binding NarL/FixJ family response regulator
MERTTVLLVDDEADLLSNMIQWLEASGYRVLGAHDGVEALALARTQHVDVVVTDLRMPRIDGLSLLAIIKELDPRIEVVVLTGQGTMQDAILALRDGRAFDFLVKPLDDLGQLNLVIEKAMVRRHHAAAVHGQRAPAAPVDVPRLPDLTERERDLLAMLARGYDNRQVADALSLSEGTVRNQLTRLYEKLGVANRTQAAMLRQDPGLT